jgi:1,4-alpha-glucan branching enzyme
MPWSGRWHEVFNSDFYDHLPNPVVAGNGGQVAADGRSGAVYPQTARVTLAANAALLFARGP